MSINIAFLQLLPGKTIDENLSLGLDACRKAKARGADIALFPEMWSCGYRFHETPGQPLPEPQPTDGEYIRQFSALAEELDMAIAVTLLEKHTPKPRNTVCLIDRHGDLLFSYAKVHTCVFGEADDESVLDAGDGFYVSELDTAAGPVQVGAMICYDREFPESARVLTLMGAELILAPNACPMELNRLSQLRGRAYENMTAIATCNYPSPHPDCNGHSTLFDGAAFYPEHTGTRDMCVTEADSEPGIIISAFDIDGLRAFRQGEKVYFDNRRPPLYGILTE